MKRIDYDDLDLDDFEVKSCPFCGSSWTDLYTDHVECNACNAQGPELDDWQKALTAWNDMPRLEGVALRRQRSMWRSRYSRQYKAQELARRERAKAERNSPEAKQSRADKEWAAKREAWLRAPVPGSTP